MYTSYKTAAKGSRKPAAVKTWLPHVAKCETDAISAKLNDTLSSWFNTAFNCLLYWTAYICMHWKSCTFNTKYKSTSHVHIMC